MQEPVVREVLAGPPRPPRPPLVAHRGVPRDDRLQAQLPVHLGGEEQEDASNIWYLPVGEHDYIVEVAGEEVEGELLGNPALLQAIIAS